MAEYILMNKEREADDTVTYRVTVDVPANPYLSRGGKTRYEPEARVGHFVYHMISGQLVFSSESDPYYLENEHVRLRCLWKMNQCREHGKFPEVVTWAS